MPFHGVLAQEAKYNLPLFTQRHVLGTQRRRTDSVRLIGVPLVAHAETESIDKVAGRGDHPPSRVRIDESLANVCAQEVQLVV